MDLYCVRCGKSYRTQSALAKHVRSHTTLLQVLEDNKELRTLLLQQQDAHAKQQAELLLHLQTQHTQLAEMIPKLGHTTNKFNLNVFLTEDCKEAVNWPDFIETLKVTLEDAPSITDNVVKTICAEISKLGITRRPIHCLDLKRKKLCLRTANVWEQDQVKVQQALHRGAVRVQERLARLLQYHPEWTEREIDTYTRLMGQILSDVDEEKCLHEISKAAYMHRALTL